MRKLTDEHCNILFGGFYLLVGFFFISVVSLFANILVVRYNPLTLTFYQYVVALVLFFPFAFSKGLDVIKTHHAYLLVFRALTSFLYYIFLYLALDVAPLVEVTLISNVSPILIPIIAMVWHGVKISWRVWVYIAMGFVGVVVILNPTGAVFNMGILWAVLAAVATALALYSTRMLAEVENMRTIFFYFYFFATLFMVPFYMNNPVVPMVSDVPMIFGMGLCLLLLQLFIYLAYRRVRPAKVAPINFSPVFFSALFGFFIFGEKIQLCFIGGGALIIVSALLTMLQKERVDP
jgi:drug/metabolite transporter (DMT)-like permease